jgi:hypothetical protein
MTTQRATSSYYVAAAALVVAIASFLVLTAMVVRSPQRFSLFQWGAPTAASCLPGSGDDACFRLQVHNTGSADGFVQCSLSPVPGTSALFHTSGLPSVNGIGGYQPSNTFWSSRAVPPSGEGLTLLIEVKADKGVTPTAPSVVCLSVPAL